MTDLLAKPTLTDEQMADWLASDEFAALPAGQGYWRAGLDAIRGAVQTGNLEAIKGTVTATRASGVGWGDIAKVLGVSLTDARKQYA